VLQQNPEAIVSTGERRPAEGGANLWKPYSILTATRRGNLMTIDGNLLNRAGPRMIAGATQLCERLEQVRQHRRTTQ
jgi:iron complex transport system substrate-binding protein